MRCQPRQILEMTQMMERCFAVTVTILGSAVKPPNVQDPRSPRGELPEEPCKAMRTLVATLETSFFLSEISDPS